MHLNFWQTPFLSMTQNDDSNFYQPVITTLRLSIDPAVMFMTAASS
jgi:hypothetical protein